MYAELLEDGRTQGDGGLSKKSVRNVHAVLREALEDAVDWNFIPRNPASKAKPPTPTARRMRMWTPEQVTAFLDAERDQREFPIWRLAATTGMRRGEVLGLSWDAVDLDGGTPFVSQTW